MGESPLDTIEIADLVLIQLKEGAKKFNTTYIPTPNMTEEPGEYMISGFVVQIQKNFGLISLASSYNTKRSQDFISEYSVRLDTIYSFDNLSQYAREKK